MAQEGNDMSVYDQLAAMLERHDSVHIGHFLLKNEQQINPHDFDCAILSLHSWLHDSQYYSIDQYLVETASIKALPDELEGADEIVSIVKDDQQIISQVIFDEQVKNTDNDENEYDEYDDAPKSVQIIKPATPIQQKKEEPKSVINVDEYDEYDEPAAVTTKKEVEKGEYSDEEFKEPSVEETKKQPVTVRPRDRGVSHFRKPTIINTKPVTDSPPKTQSPKVPRRVTTIEKRPAQPAIQQAQVVVPVPESPTKRVIRARGTVVKTAPILKPTTTEKTEVVNSQLEIKPVEIEVSTSTVVEPSIEPVTKPSTPPSTVPASESKDIQEYDEYDAIPEAKVPISQTIIAPPVVPPHEVVQVNNVEQKAPETKLETPITTIRPSRRKPLEDLKKLVEIPPPPIQEIEPPPIIHEIVEQKKEPELQPTPTKTETPVSPTVIPPRLLGPRHKISSPPRERETQPQAQPELAKPIFEPFSKLMDTKSALATHPLLNKLRVDIIAVIEGERLKHGDSALASFSVNANTAKVINVLNDLNTILSHRAAVSIFMCRH
jgi:hypothetical protein